MKTDKSLQDTFAPNNGCFGCGPANQLGLQIKSFPVHESKGNTGEGGFELLAHWKPQKHHEAFENMLNGGIVGALLDCHCNWAAAYCLMLRDDLEHPPCTVTARYSITLPAPTRTDQQLTLKARVDRSDDRQVVVNGEIEFDGTVTAICNGLFVAVREGHPAFHRW